jgi:hypothetical protein
MKTPTYHLYYRLPWHGAAVGRRDNPKYTIYRSDTEVVVGSCDTQEQTEKICAEFKRRHTK